MSLINDALRKARLEAARKQSLERDKPLPSYWEESSHQSSDQQRMTTIVLFALGAAAVVIVATLVILRTPASGDLAAAGSAEVPPPEVERSTLPAVAEDTPSVGHSDASTPSPEAGERRETPRPDPAGGTVSSHTSAGARAPQVDQGSEQTGDPVGTAEPRASGPRAVSAPSRPEPSDTVRPTGGSSAAAATDRVQPPPTDDAAESSSAVESPASEPARVSRAPSAADATPDPAPTVREPGEAQAPAVNGRDDMASFLRQADLPDGATYRLDGIAWSSDQPFALVNGQVVGAGGYVDGAKVTVVARDRVVLTRDDYRFELLLR